MVSNRGLAETNAGTVTEYKLDIMGMFCKKIKIQTEHHVTFSHLNFFFWANVVR